MKLSLSCVCVVAALALAVLPMMSQTKKASLPAFSEDVAMWLLLPQYDAKSRTAHMIVSAEADEEAQEQGYKVGTEVVVVPYWTKSYREAGTVKAVLLTYAVPYAKDDFDCHACEPLIGMAVFRWANGAWALDASNLNIIRAGAWGNPPPDAGPFLIGPNHTAVRIKDIGTGGGETSESWRILAPWKKTVHEVLNISIADDNAGGCEKKRPSEEMPCYSYRKTMTRARPAGSEFDDLIFTLKGTDSDDKVWETINPVSGVERFHFSDGKFIRVYRHGSIPQLEQFIQKHQ